MSSEAWLMGFLIIAYTTATAISYLIYLKRQINYVRYILRTGYKSHKFVGNLSKRRVYRRILEFLPFTTFFALGFIGFLMFAMPVHEVSFENRIFSVILQFYLGGVSALLAVVIARELQLTALENAALKIRQPG